MMGVVKGKINQLILQNIITSLLLLKNIPFFFFFIETRYELVHILVYEARVSFKYFKVGICIYLHVYVSGLL